VTKTIWVVIGQASRLPVAAFTDEVSLATWLRLRRGTGMLALYRIDHTKLDQPKTPVAGCIHCVLERWS
jgi:hypothetical protein